MRQIEVSTDTFALIWASRRPGENSEDEILRRILKRGEDKALKSTATAPARGVYDDRHGVSFPEGLEIFRTYRGRSYRAYSRENGWHIVGHNGAVKNLNQLSRTIGATTENAWKNWMYLNEIGLKRPISDFRTSVRSKPQINNEEDESMGTWRADVELGLKQLGTVATLNEIYEVVRKIRQSFGRTIPISADAIIRRTLEENCSNTESYKGLFDIFWMPDGKGAGRWALR